MQPLKKPKNPREAEASSPVGNKKKRERPWILEYQWKSLKDWNTCPNWSYFGKSKEYSEEWYDVRFGKYINHDHAVQAIKKDLRNEFLKRRYEGKNFRVRNKLTNEIILIEL